MARAHLGQSRAVWQAAASSSPPTAPPAAPPPPAPLSDAEVAPPSPGLKLELTASGELVAAGLEDMERKEPAMARRCTPSPKAPPPPLFRINP